MGFLPLFVALLGLILLYTLYTYNQIKPRKANLNRVIDAMAANSRERKQLVLQHEQNNPALQELAEKLRKTSTDRFQSYKKEEEFIEELEQATKQLANEDLAHKLNALNHRQQELIQNLKAKAKEYNSFIGKSPASAVASAFGFRQF
ncbi:MULTISPECIES: hypothetical protein [unclassified Roseivirga]|uniref:hypothetical protein n=1 Tax=unclassified Roseivirga TaxID=2626142 RepID=UPI0025809570|nr:MULTISPECIES: hypothetical protein [unclassified Roseivirga]MEC7754125.1 hypothetical protein [Bacteroidota bacterium]|tara:strand:- start:553 stop:993 length:441 start_codon:yes stop_codon:yes gene_type:complete